MPEKPTKSPETKTFQSIVVSLTPPDTLWDELNKNKDNIHPLAFYVAKKGDNYGLLGNNLPINPKEDPASTMLRAAMKDGGITPLGVPKTTVLGTHKDKDGNNIQIGYIPIMPPNGAIPVGTNDVEEIVPRHLDAIKKMVLEDSPDAMQKGLSYMEHLEEYFKKKFTGLCIKNGQLCRADEFKKIYQTMLAEFMTRGLHSSAHTRPEKKESGTENINAALNSGFYGRDILYFLPQVAQYGPQWEGLSNATEGMKLFMAFSQEIVDGFIQLDNLSQSQEEMQTFLKNTNISMKEKHEKKESFNRYVRTRLKETFGLKDEQLDSAQGEVHRFLVDQSKDLKIADSHIAEGLYQEFMFLNEVTNANFGQTLLYFLGMNNEDQTHQEHQLRFQSGRQWLLFLKALNGIQYYKEQKKLVTDGRFQDILTYFFGPAIGNKSISLGRDGHAKEVYVRKYKDRRVVIDEKPYKSFASFLRKSFFEKLGDINDFEAVSIVLVETADDGPKQKIDLIRTIKNDLIDYIKKQYPQLTFSLEHEKDNLSVVLEKKDDGHFSGKRVGSQSSRIPRIKFLMKLGDEQIEIALYPFETINDGSELLGWQEKIKDDKRYENRRLLDGQNGLPAFYFLLFPPGLNSSQYTNIVDMSRLFNSNSN